MNRLMTGLCRTLGRPCRLLLEPHKANYSQKTDVVTEEQIQKILLDRFSNASVRVEDVSGGCGAMFNISIETSDFKGLSIPKQHRLVYQTLQKQIESIHGLHLETKIPTS